MPWHVVVGYDEHVPGDKLKIKNLRKSMVLAFNFLELGEEVLQRDSTWFIPVIVRSSMLENVHAGWSQAPKLFFRRMLIHESSPAKAGIAFICDDIAHIIYVIVSDIISDGDGHRQGLEWIGAGGLKPCFLHGNVWSKNSGMADGENVDITSHESERFVLNDHDRLYDNVDLVVGARGRYDDGRMVKARFDDLKKAAGLNTTVHGLLNDPDLREAMKILDVVVLD